MFASLVNMNFTVCCYCLSQRNAPPSPFNIMTPSALIAFWEGPCSPYLGKLAALPLMHHDVLSFCLSCLGRQFASEQQHKWSTAWRQVWAICRFSGWDCRREWVNSQVPLHNYWSLCQWVTLWRKILNCSCKAACLCWTKHMFQTD